jgi:hypothetical protein
MPRPSQIPTRLPLTGDQVAAASYAGSPEHKVLRWWGGLPAAREDHLGRARRRKRQHTTICRKVTERERQIASGWVRAALAAGQYRFFEGDAVYPKHIWYVDGDGQFWFGFAINQIAGTYKGWPISAEEKREAFDRVAGAAGQCGP